MNTLKAVFDHIEQTRYALSQIFESGFTSGRNSSGLLECEKTAAELGLSGGAQLLKNLGSVFTALAAGQGTIREAAVVFCNVISYYNFVTDTAIIETMSCKQVPNKE